MTFKVKFMPSNRNFLKVQKLVREAFQLLSRFDRFYFHMHRHKGYLYSNPEAAQFNQRIEKSRALIIALAKEFHINSPTAIQVVSAHISEMANCGELAQLMVMYLIDHEIFGFHQHAIEWFGIDHTFLAINIDGTRYIIDPFFQLFVPETDFLNNQDVLSYLKFPGLVQSINQLPHKMSIIDFSRPNVTPQQIQKTKASVNLLLSEAKSRKLELQLPHLPHGTQTPDHVFQASQVVGQGLNITIRTFKNGPDALRSNTAVQRITFFTAPDEDAFIKMKQSVQSEVPESCLVEDQKACTLSVAANY